MISMIMAITLDGFIADLNDNLPLYLPQDLKRFKRLTYGKTVLMGRRTWECLPIKPLPGRKNIVISNSNKFSGCITIRDFSELDFNEDIFVIGGTAVWQYFLDKNLIDIIYLTLVQINLGKGISGPNIDFNLFYEPVVEFGSKKHTYFTYYNRRLNYSAYSAIINS